MPEINDQSDLNQDTVNEASQLLYVSLGRERTRLIPLAFTMPDDVPPIQVDGLKIGWTNEALATFAKMQRDICDNNSAFFKNMPYAWLRGLIEVSLQNVFRIDPSIGLSQYALRNEAQNPEPFVYLADSNESETRTALAPLLHDWIVNSLIPYAQREGVTPATINQLQNLQVSSQLLSIVAFKSQILPWSWSNQTATTQPKDKYSFPILVDYIARRIARQKIFRGLSPIKRIITSRSGITTGLVELSTDPISLSNQGLFSLVVELEVVTFPSLHQPLLRLNIKKRRWLNSLAEDSFDSKVINGLIFSRNHPDRAFSYQLTRREWKTDSAFEVLRRELQLPTQIFDAHQIVRGEASTNDCQVLLTYREGIRDRQEEHGIETGVPEIDQLEAFDAIAKILEPIGLKPFNDYARVTFGRGQSHTIDNTTSRTINAPTLIGATLQLLETGERNDFTPQYLASKSDREINRLLHKYFQISLDAIQQKWKTVKLSNQEKDQTSELQAMIAANQELIQRIYPNEQPLLIIFYEDGAKQDFRILEAVVRLLWGNALDVKTNKLPANMHGPKAELPGNDLKAAGRAEKRRKAWEPIAKQIAALNRRTFCLVVAREFYLDSKNDNAFKHDDPVNKPSTRQALAAIAGACVQFLLPPQRAKKTGTINLSDFLYRVQEAMKDLVWAHSGRIDDVQKKLNQWLSETSLEAKPKEIIAITIVRKNGGRSRSGFGTTFLPIAIRIDIETEKCEMCCAYEQGNNLKISPWQFFSDALSTISQISPVRLAKNMHDAKTRFKNFVEQIISASVEEEKNPLVIIDSSNCSRLWPWLTDREIDVGNIHINEHKWMQDTWQGVRIIRIRQELAPNIIEDKILSLAQTSLEDTRKKALLPEDHKLSTPSSQITGLFRLKSTKKTGCIAYLSLRHDGINRKKRGLSCYRETEVARPVKVNKALLLLWYKLYQEIQNDRVRKAQKFEVWFIKLVYYMMNERTNNNWWSVFNKAGYNFHALEMLAPHVDKWSNPNPLEIVVTLRQEGDNPDRLAALVESLRCGFGHYSRWTTLPALLFFERVVRDYISVFALEDNDSEAESEIEDGN